MSKQHIPFKAKLARSRGTPCRAEGCNVGRDSISPYCGRHRIAFERYGDPHGFRLRRKRDYWHELELVQAFLVKHREHEGVKAALSWLDKWLREDANAERLRGHCITPL